MSKILSADRSFDNLSGPQALRLPGYAQPEWRPFCLTTNESDQQQLPPSQHCDAAVVTL